MGYFQLLMDHDLADWLNERVTESDWLLFDMSQLWPRYKLHPRPRELPGLSGKGTFILIMCLDASSWPAPAEEICSIIEEYSETREGEQED